jgi:hypothetical protein
MAELAPIVLFTYKRLANLQNTIEALKLNFLSAESDLIIYSDGPKSPNDQAIIDEIRLYLATITGFKSVQIHAAKVNRGLANSIISGVSEVMRLYHKAIVLEDDLLTSRNFLSFMNQALSFYEQKKQVYAISGYAFDLKNEQNEMDGYFLTRSWSWGWATWEDRWSEIDWNVSDYQSFSHNWRRKSAFAKLGSDVNKMLASQMNGTLDSWYIRSTYHQFKINGLAFYPAISKIDNNGFDDFATNTRGFKNRYLTTVDQSERTDFKFPDLIEIDAQRQANFQRKLGFANRILNKIMEFIFK